MKTILLTTLVVLSIITSLSAQEKLKDQWVTLLDKNFTHWEKYLGYPDKGTVIEGWPKDTEGNYTKPLGVDNDAKGVFTIIEMEGEPVLRITGEIYGCVATKQEYKNYHLVLQVKWGTKKWIPRLDQEKDSGILYHSIGDYGVDYWKSWMLSEELQIIEGGFGDYWSIAGSMIDIKAEKLTEEENYIYSKDAPLVSFDSENNFCRRGKDLEVKDSWNTVELICFGDKSLHIVNGEVVMALTNPRYRTGNVEKPLVKGKIQIQSEAAEVYYKGIKIKSIDNIPNQYLSYFN